MPHREFESKLIAILSADVAGYSLLMGENEAILESKLAIELGPLSSFHRALLGMYLVHRNVNLQTYIT